MVKRPRLSLEDNVTDEEETDESLAIKNDGSTTPLSALPSNRNNSIIPRKVRFSTKTPPAASFSIELDNSTGMTSDLSKMSDKMAANVSLQEQNSEISRILEKNSDISRILDKNPDISRILDKNPDPGSIRFSTPVRKSNSLSPPEIATTPFRTPKLLKTKKIPVRENDRILGTPDYLAPELLLRLPHSYGVDWWGLGICLYEFMTGIPPFTDETPDKVFDNILNMRIEWPEDEAEVLSNQAVDAIQSLLTADQDERADFEKMQKMELFQDLDWSNLTDMEAPFVPQPDDETDTGYFEARNVAQHWKVSQIRD